MVCLSVTYLRSAKVAEQIDIASILFVVETLGGGVPMPLQRGEWGNVTHWTVYKTVILTDLHSPDGATFDAAIAESL